MFRTRVPATTTGLPARLSVAKVAEINGGRLPIGIGTTTTEPLAATYQATATLTVWLDSRTNRVVDVAWSQTDALSVRAGLRAIALDRPYAQARTALPVAVSSAAATAARSAHATLGDRSRLHGLAVAGAVLAAFALLLAASFWLFARRRPAQTPVPVSAPSVELQHS